MRGKARQAEMQDEDKYGFVKPDKIYGSKPRLNLNDLLQRMEDQKRDDKKLNLIIISAALIVACVVFLILSI